MKILQICHKPPFPPVDGGAIAMNNITQGLLGEGHSVKVLSICTAKHFVKKEELPQDYLAATQFECIYVDTSIKFRKAFANLFTDKSYNVERFICDEFGKKIQAIVQNSEFDIVLLESLFVAPYINLIRKYSQAKVILRAHNVEHKIWERMSVNCKNPIKKLYLNLLSKRLKDFEIKSLKKVDAICAMTEIDATNIEMLVEECNIVTLPSGYLLEELSKPSQIKEEKHSIFHLASMDWQPNLEAVDWFLEKVWPTVSKQNPNCKFYLAGREMPKKYYDLKINNLEVVGDVPSAKDFFESKQIMLVPLLSGSGMRIKIIEGMAIGKVIISTSIGAEGIDCTHRKDILIANTPQEFINSINVCLKDESLCAFISENAKLLIKNHYDNRSISKKLTQFFQNISRG